MSSIIPLTDEFIFHSYGLISLVSGYTLAFLSTLFIRLSEKITNRIIITILLVLSYFLAFAVCFTPIGLPFKALRFFFGLYNFSCFMSLHSRIMNTLHLMKKLNNAKEDLNHNTITPKTTDSFYGELMSTYLFNVRSRITVDKSVRHIPTFQRIIYWLTHFIIMDFLVYILIELVPDYISPPNQYFASAFVSSILILFAMSWNYSNYIIIMALGYNTSLPVEMRHCHPLLSSSISEFWGQRWNPIIGKLIQESFYKPLRRLGVNRALCIIFCFIGSAVLHAFPQFLSTRDLSDGAMMGSFFIIHGIITLIEQSILGNVEKEVPIVKAKYQWVAETFTICFVFLLFYYFTEAKATTYPTILCTTIFLCIGASVFTLHVHSDHQRGQIFPPLLKSLSIWIGWIYTLTILCLTMPLFSIPAWNAISTLYRKSYVIGPFIRALQQNKLI